MKKYFVSVVCLCAGIILASCSKDDDDATSAISSINATVENGSSYNSKVDNVKAFLDSDAVDDYSVATSQFKDGGFTISLPETVDSKYLSTFDFGEGITVSDPNTKQGEVSTFMAYKSGVIVGEFYYATYSWTSNALSGTDAGYIYVDRDVKITGSTSGKDGSETYITSINILLKKGWNNVYWTVAYSSATETVTNTLTNTAPSGMKWYFEESESKSAVMVKSAMATGSKHKSLFKQLN